MSQIYHIDLNVCRLYIVQSQQTNMTSVQNCMYVKCILHMNKYQYMVTTVNEIG